MREIKIFLVDGKGMHGQGRVFPFFITETSSVSVCPLVGLLDSTAEVTVVVDVNGFTNLALPEINHVSGFTVQCS